MKEKKNNYQLVVVLAPKTEAKEKVLAKVTVGWKKQNRVS
jgi:hypothetical protein